MVQSYDEDEQIMSLYKFKTDIHGHVLQITGGGQILRTHREVLPGKMG